MARQSIIKSALILTICGLVCKILGALYRIPLTNILGGTGMGMYYLVFPIFSFMLSLSSASLPAAISKLVAESLSNNDEKSAKKYFKCSFVIFFLFGTFCTIFVMVIAPLLCRVQNNTSGIMSYLVIAPSILIVCLVSCYRGYFQGYQNMTYSGVSQVIEQTIKIGLGLILTAKMAVYGLEWGVLGAIIAITASEVVALAYLFFNKILFERKNKKANVIENCLDKKSGVIENQKADEKSNSYYYKSILKTSIPFTLGYVIFPLGALIDSIMVVPLLVRSGVASETAICVYGLNNAIVGTLTNLPIVVSTSLAMVILPSLSYAMKSGSSDNITPKISFVYKVAINLVLPCVIVFAVFSKWVISAIFGTMSSSLIDEFNISSNMLIWSSIGVLYLTFFQISTAILQAKGDYYKPVISLGIGVFIKVVLSIILLNFSSINFYAVNIASDVCYIVICYINMHYLEKSFRVNISMKSVFLYPIISCTFMCLAIYLAGLGLAYILPIRLAYLFAFIVGGGVYLVSGFLLKSFSKEELGMMLGRR